MGPASSSFSKLPDDPKWAEAHLGAEHLPVTWRAPSNHMEGVVGTGPWVPQQTFLSSKSGMELGVCIFNKFPGDPLAPHGSGDLSL